MLSRSCFECTLKAICVSESMIPSILSSLVVTMSARSSQSRTRMIAVRSNRPAME